MFGKTVHVNVQINENPKHAGNVIIMEQGKQNMIYKVTIFLILNIKFTRNTVWKSFIIIVGLRDNLSCMI